MPFLKELETITSASRALRNKLQEILLSLPDNPKITRLSANCFRVSLRDTGLRLDPSYHDFKLQYTALVKYFDHVGVEDIPTVWAKLRTGRERERLGVRLHPEVIAQVDKLFQEAPKPPGPGPQTLAK